MSYRSEVTLVLSYHGVEALYAKMAESKINAEITDNVVDFLRTADIDYIDDISSAEFWYWERTTWDNDTNNAIDFIEEFLAELPPEDYYFIRIGDDINDNVLIGAFCNNPFEVDFYREIRFKKR